MQISRLRGQSSQGAVLQGDSFKFKLSVFFLSGDLCDLEPPLPISNREVKQVSVDDSDWATDCESRSSLGKPNNQLKGWFFGGDDLLPLMCPPR